MSKAPLRPVVIEAGGCFREKFRGDVRGEIEKFGSGFDQHLMRGGVALFGEAQDRGGEGRDDAVGFGVGVKIARDRAGIGGVAELRVRAHGGAEPRGGEPALEFQQRAGDGAAAEFVAAARIAEAPTRAAGVVDAAISRAGGDK